MSEALLCNYADGLVDLCVDVGSPTDDTVATDCVEVVLRMDPAHSCP